MKINSISTRDYESKLYGTVVTQLYPRHKSGLRVGYLVSRRSSDNKKCTVVWWDYRTGTWTTRFAHPRLDTLTIPMPKIGYFVDSSDRLRYAELQNVQKNRWAYGLSYYKLKDSGMDDRNILSLYGIYPPRTNNPYYIGVDRCKYKDGVLIDRCIYKEAI